MKQLIVLLILVLVVAACGPTGDSASDSVSAETLLPNINGYARTDTVNLQDAITAAGSGAALTSGNAPLAAGIARIDVMVDCFREVGAVAANSYVESSPSDIIPKAGIVAVINQTRVESNLLACALTTGGDASAQAVGGIEPCGASGSFVYRENNITYVYAATNPELCGLFQGHFTSVEQNQ